MPHVLFQNGPEGVACRVGRFADGRLYCIVPDELDGLEGDELGAALNYTPDELFDFHFEWRLDPETGERQRIFFRKRPRTSATDRPQKGA